VGTSKLGSVDVGVAVGVLVGVAVGTSSGTRMTKPAANQSVGMQLPLRSSLAVTWKR
jgi:hypothetical protein